MSTSGPSADAPSTTAARRVPFASYVDVTSPHPDLAATRAATGQGWYILSFVLADHGKCAPSWGGIRAVGDSKLVKQVRDLRAAGGTVSVASGGALGAYLENTCTDATSLAAAYSTALDAVGSDRLDVDIEQIVQGDVVADALTLLLRQRTVHLTVTVGVLSATDGIDPRTLPLLHTLVDNGTPFTLNAMVFNIGVRDTWQATLLSSADTVAGQFAKLLDTDRGETDRRLALTLMVGRDDLGAVTTLADAAVVRDYAVAHGFAALAIWSMPRDNGGCRPDVLAEHCSGVAQRPFEYTDVLSGSGT
ncbi:MAG TPA: carbohydrate-binding protein CenC [Pseudonocardiaceae bacterium]|nr:carbohydrate-binding protein CenC [Pseudonocardiaceae bacterium]